MSDRLVIVDGHNILYRSFFAMSTSNLRTTQGEPTGALFGTLQALRVYLREMMPTHMLWCFDRGRSTFRTALREGYKGHRKYASTEVAIDPRRDLPPQTTAFVEFLDLYGIAHHSEDGVEADDLIATAVGRFAEMIDVVVVSGDHDLLQLVSDRVRVYRPGQQTKRGAIGLRTHTAFYGPQEVYAKYQVDPDQLPTLWALTGDRGDSIEGISGVGPKTAAKWIATHGSSLTRILLAEEKCRGYERRCWENYQMIDLDGTVGTIPFDLPELRLPERVAMAPLAKFEDYFRRWEMTSLFEIFSRENGW